MVTTRRLMISLVLTLSLFSTSGDGNGSRPPDHLLPSDPTKLEFEEFSKEGDFFNGARRTPGYMAAYREAVREAKDALKHGRAHLYTYGFLGVSSIDTKTGLCEERIAGCLVTEELLGRVEGNNNSVHSWIKRHGPAPNYLLRWTDELLDVAAYFDVKKRVGETIPLNIGGPDLKSPDGQFVIRQVAEQIQKGIEPNVRDVTTVGLEVLDQTKVSEPLADYWNNGLEDFAWGPPGAPFAVVRSRNREGFDFMILNLRPANWVSEAELIWQRHLKEHPEVE